MQPTINEWARRHHITPEALRELQAVLAWPADIEHQPGATGSEASAQQRVRLEAPKHGVRLWRNNVGACVDERGNHIRYGLMNESAGMNRRIKSPDLVGITPVTINPEHMGSTLGIFTGIECKRPGWKYKGNKREAAQLACLELIMSMGGRAQFATGPGDIWS